MRLLLLLLLHALAPGGANHLVATCKATCAAERETCGDTWCAAAAAAAAVLPPPEVCRFGLLLSHIYIEERLEREGKGWLRRGARLTAGGEAFPAPNSPPQISPNYPICLLATDIALSSTHATAQSLARPALARPALARSAFARPALARSAFARSARSYASLA